MKNLATKFDAIPVPKVPNLNGTANQRPNDSGTMAIGASLSLEPWIIPDGADITPRPWLYGYSYLAGAVTGTVAPGGAGKSILTLAEALAMAAIKDGETHGFLGKWCRNGLKVAYLNLEDDRDERDRRAAAIVQYYNLDVQQIAKRLLRPEAADFGLRVVHMNGGEAIICKDIGKLEEAIMEYGIDVLVLDPYVSIHSASENDNCAMDLVVKALSGVARRTGACIHIVHHVGKLRGESLSADSARGASAIVDAMRAVRGIAPMTKSQATLAGLQNPDGIIWVGGIKSNYTTASNVDWYRLKSVQLDNADEVGIPVLWQHPDTIEAISKEDAVRVLLAIQNAQPIKADPQSHGVWAGSIIGEAMGWNVPDGTVKKANRTPEQSQALAKVNRAIGEFVKTGALVKSKIDNPRRAGRQMAIYNVSSAKTPNATT